VPIQGNIEEAGLPDVLQLLSLGRKSGCLTLVDGDAQGSIYLDVGRISYATVANRLDRLGDMLVKSGRITQQQLSTAVEEQRRSGKRQLGRILVDSGQIDRGELERFIRQQVENAVYYLFTWKQGTFSFASDRLPPHQPLLVSLDAEGLLLEGARRVDEWSLIQKKIPSFDLVYRCTREKLGSSADGLTEEQKTILPLLDGTRDVAAIIDFTALSEFEVGKALYGLVTAGFIQLVERRAHIRHLEYRDLLAYVVREAEFADAQRRKEAARHIVDCPTCAERLRTIHVRRSTGSGMVPVDIPDELPSFAAPAAAPALRPQTTQTFSTTLSRQPAVAQAQSASAPRRTVAPPRPAMVEPERFEVAARARPPQDSFEIAAHGGRPPEPPAPPHVARPASEHAGGGPSQRAPATETRHAAAAPPSAPAEASFVERRSRDRRTGRDRRAFDRRTGLDRRHEAALAGLQPAVERRRGPRRDEDRRGASSRDRRGSDTRQRPAAAPPEPVFEATAVETVEQVVEDALDLVPQDRPSIETTSVTDELMAASRPEIPAPPPAAKPPAAPPAPAADAEGADLEWLVSPRESLEMIRASQAQLRAMAAAGQQGRPGAPPPPKHVPDRRGAGAAAAAAGAATVRNERRLERFRAGTNGERATDTPKTGTAPAPRYAFPLRSLAVAAGVACVALLGYMAGQIGRRGGAGKAGESTEAAALPVPARAESPRAGTRSRVAEPPRTAAPAPQATPVESRPEERPRGRPAPVNVAAAPAPRPVAPAAAPAPTVGVIRGSVHDASGAAVPGARVSVRGTSLAAVADASGAFEIRDVPDGQVDLQASADGFVTGDLQVRATAGATVAADLALNRVPPPRAAVAAAPAAAAKEPDQELAAGGWAPVDRAEATSLLGGTLGAIQGLGIESISKSLTGTRARIRVAQLTSTGERIVLTETRAGAAVRGGTGPAVVTALRVMPASEAYPWCTGTASLGNILVTMKTKLAADVVRPMLQRLGEISTE